MMGEEEFGMEDFPRHEADEVSEVERKINVPNGTKPIFLAKSHNNQTSKLCTECTHGHILVIRTGIIYSTPNSRANRSMPC